MGFQRFFNINTLMKVTHPMSYFVIMMHQETFIKTIIF